MNRSLKTCWHVTYEALLTKYPAELRPERLRAQKPAGVTTWKFDELLTKCARQHCRSSVRSASGSGPPTGGHDPGRRPPVGGGGAAGAGGGRGGVTCNT